MRQYEHTVARRMTEKRGFSSLLDSRFRIDVEPLSHLLAELYRSKLAPSLPTPAPAFNPMGVVSRKRTDSRTSSQTVRPDLARVRRDTVLPSHRRVDTLNRLRYRPLGRVEISTVHRVPARCCFLMLAAFCALSVSSAVAADDIAALREKAEKGDMDAQE